MKHDILVIENDEALRWLLENILKDRFRVTISKDFLSAMARMANGNRRASYSATSIYLGSMV